MTNLSSFIARRYLAFKDKNKQITFMLWLCFTGIALGSCALMLTLIIMHGFEVTIHEKMQGITSQVVMNVPGKKLDDQSIKSFLCTHFPQTVQAASSSCLRQVLFEKNDMRTVLFLRGIEPDQEAKVSTLESKIVSALNNNPSLTTLLTDNHILIGHKLAEQYGFKPGDIIDLMIPEPASKKKIVLSKQKAVIAGIFKIGLEEYDNNYAVCSLPFLKTIFEEKKGVDQISLKLKEQPHSWFSFTHLKNIFWPFAPDPDQLIINQLREKLPGIGIHSWKDLYPALVSSLKLEKYVMFFILALIVLVASMNMISLLFMQVQQKRRDIAILKTMGMPSNNIIRIFLRMGLILTTCASLCGLGVAAIIGYFLERYPFIQLPDAYYISYLPARVEPHLFIIVFVCTLLLGFLASWIPAKRSTRVNITQVLRHE